MNDTEYYKKRLENYERQCEEEKRSKVTGGKLLMVAFGLLVMYGFFPWREQEFTDIHWGFCIAGFILGLVVWLQGKGSLD